MKKLIIPLLLFCFFVIPKNTFALSYTANNNQEYQVDSSESLRDYFYFTNIYNTNNNYNFYVFDYSSYNAYCVNSYLINEGGPTLHLKTSNRLGFSTSCSSSFNNSNTICIDKDTYNDVTASATSILSSNVIYYSSYYDCNNSSIVDSNFSYQSILDKYDSSSEEESEVNNMFESSIQLIRQFIPILPIFIGLYVVFDIIGNILFSRRY